MFLCMSSDFPVELAIAQAFQKLEGKQGSMPSTVIGFLKSRAGGERIWGKGGNEGNSAQ